MPVRAIHTPHTWMWSDNLFVQSSPMSVCLVSPCNGTQHPSVFVCECKSKTVRRKRERKRGCETETDRDGEKERQIEKESMCAWRLHMCVSVRAKEHYCISQCAVSGLAVWADTDYSFHSSLSSQATIATAKALYFKKLQHCAGSRIALKPTAWPKNRAFSPNGTCMN